jgi:hypothetical protein
VNKTITQAAAPSNAARTPAQSAGNENNNDFDPIGLVQGWTWEQRQAVMAQLKLAEKADIDPLKQQQDDLEKQLKQLKAEIDGKKLDDSKLGLYRKIRNAVKAGNKTVEDIAAAAGVDDVEAVKKMLTKHLKGKDDKSPIFTIVNGDYILTPKTKK